MKDQFELAAKEQKVSQKKDGVKLATTDNTTQSPNKNSQSAFDDFNQINFNLENNLVQSKYHNYKKAKPSRSVVFGGKNAVMLSFLSDNKKKEFESSD